MINKSELMDKERKRVETFIKEHLDNTNALLGMVITLLTEIYITLKY